MIHIENKSQVENSLLQTAFEIKIIIGSIWYLEFYFPGVPASVLRHTHSLSPYGHLTKGKQGSTSNQVFGWEGLPSAAFNFHFPSGVKHIVNYNHRLMPQLS